MNYRIIYSDNGTLKDFSTALNKYTGGQEVMPYTTSEDYLYIGSRFPFNSFYLMLNAYNSIDAQLIVSYWTGNEWRDAIEVNDETNGLKNDGKISFVPSKTYASWARDDTVMGDDSTEEVEGLGGVVIYDHYWLRLKWSATLTSSTALSWIGMKLANDEDLFLEYPFFDNSAIKTAYSPGKTDWKDQAVVASGLVIDDLIRKGIIENQSQLLDTDKLRSATVSKLAQVIYKALGDDYVDEVASAKKECYSRLHKSIFDVDSNNNAILDDMEKRSRQGFLYR